MLNVGTTVGNIRRYSRTRLFHRALAVGVIAIAGVQLLHARTMASDDFNRANSSTLGADWTATSSGMSISANKAMPAAGGGSDHKFSYYSGSSWNPTHSSQAVFYGALGADMTLTVRHQTNGDLYFLDVNSGSQHLKIFKSVGGAMTQLRVFGLSPVSGHTF